MTRVLAIDPGAGGAGYCVWDSEQNAPIYIGSTPPLRIGMYEAVVCESGFIGKMGRQSMWGLGADAGWRMCQASFDGAVKCFTIRPDGVNGWRAALPDRADLHASRRFSKFDGLPGDVIVARLRLRYGLTDISSRGHAEHEVEACGIAEAAAAILARPKAKDRKALKPVKRGAL